MYFVIKNTILKKESKNKKQSSLMNNNNLQTHNQIKNIFFHYNLKKRKEIEIYLKEKQINMQNNNLYSIYMNKINSNACIVYVKYKFINYYYNF